MNFLVAVFLLFSPLAALAAVQAPPAVEPPSREEPPSTPIEFERTSEEIAESLLSVAESAEEPRLRAAAVESLCLFGKDDVDWALEYVADVVARSSETALVHVALDCFLDIDYPAVVGGLLGRLSDPDSLTRMRAVRALGRPGLEDKERILPALRRALNDPTPDVVKNAIEALGAWQDPGALRLFEDIVLRSRADDPVDAQATRWTLARSLKDYTDEPSVHLLETLVSDPYDPVAVTAAESLAYRKAESALQRIEARAKMADDPSFRKKFKAAIQALRR